MEIVIAIDGPVASGKSTVAKLVAARLGYRYIDTGAMYRCIALLVHRNNLDAEDESQVATVLPGTVIELARDGRVILNDEDVSAAIRLPEISRLVSIISVHKKVRDYMLEQQIELARNKGVVMEGRDIGSRVAPDAELKIFQVASVESRANRRYLELRQKGIECDLGQLMDDIKERDHRDSTRTHAPLVQVADAIHLDTSKMSAEEVADQIVVWARERIDG